MSKSKQIEQPYITKIAESAPKYNCQRCQNNMNAFTSCLTFECPKELHIPRKDEIEEQTDPTDQQ
jgi:hypothetical protein